MTAVADATDLRRAFRAFRPTPRQRLASWAILNIVNDQGRPYDHAAYPHLGAPGGPMDAFDDLRTRTITLEWATRLGKTFFAQCALLYTADVNPGPMMCASAVEKLAKEVVARTYAMIHARPALNKKLAKSKREQRQDLIEFKSCLAYVAWSRSVSTLADKNVKVGHAGEYDKWEHASTSKEAHPHKLFDDRFKDYQSVRKVIYEGTPTVRGRSPIEHRYQSGTQCRLYVPCPHCRTYQRIEMGNDAEWGVKWDREENGEQSPAKAYQTARYVCRECRGAWLDHHRPWVIRRGVWCPEGCEVDGDEAIETTERNIAAGEPVHEWRGWKHCRWVRGEPRFDGQDASYQLSSLYALSLGWGDVAKEFVTSKDNPQELRNFVNQWLGETWETKRSKTTPELITERIRIPTDRGIVPHGGTYLVVSADRQGADGGFIVWTAVAHGADERAWLVDYGTCQSLEEFWVNVCRRHYPHADGGLQLVPCAVVIDSGWNTKETYDFCIAHPGAMPCKGASEDLGGMPYKIVTLGKGTATGYAGQTLMHVATDIWETDLQWRLENLRANEPRSFSLCRAASYDRGFLAQLFNATLSDAVDSRGNAKLLWVKKDENQPNDFRDAIRYNLCLARAYIDEQGLPTRTAQGTVSAARAAKDIIIPGATRPDGRNWLDG